MKRSAISHLSALLASTWLLASAQTASADGLGWSNKNSTTTERSTKLFSYAGSMIPDNWLVVSTINDRVVLGFTNGSAINANINDLDPADRNLILMIRDGTMKPTSSPTAITKEKLSQWTSQFTSTVTKFGKSLKDQFDSFINNHSSGSGDNNKNLTLTKLNETIVIT